MVATGPIDVKALAKAELHCHLDGVLDRAMAWDIHRADPAFPIDPRELAPFYPILERHIEWLKAQRVRYSEVMIAASTIPEDKVESVEKLGALRDWVHRKESGDIQIEFLVGLGRNRSPDVFGFDDGDFEQLYARTLEARFQPVLRMGRSEKGLAR